MLISVDEARRYARDNESDAGDLELLIAAAEEYIKNGVGAVDPEDPEAKLLCGLLVCEFNDKREMSAAEKNVTRSLVDSIKAHLRLKGATVSDSDTLENGVGGHDS